MDITIDTISLDDDGNKIVYLHFIDDDNKIVDTACVLYADDPDTFGADVAKKFKASMKRVLDNRAAADKVQSHLTAMELDKITLDEDTHEVKFTKEFGKAKGV